jgi:hypothetical protein
MPNLTWDSEVVFDHLQGYTLHLEAYWQAFKRLFDGNSELIPVLIDSASDFFMLVQNAFMQQVLQMLRVLTDSATNRPTNSRNASLKGLLLAVYGPTSESLPPNLHSLATQLTQQVDSIRLFVNRSVAHADWNVVCGHESIETIPVRQVEDALVTLRQFLDIFAETFHLSRREYGIERMNSQISRMIALLSAGSVVLSAEPNP